MDAFFVMDPFRSCLAFGPVAIYLVLLGALNLARRSFLVSGTRDAAALALAVSGLLMVGPMELFFPEAALARLGSSAGALLLAFYVALYGLSLVLLLLTLRPRLIIYNIAADQLRPILAETVERLDPAARWAGDSLALPGLGVQLHVDSHAAMRNVSLVSAGPHQDYVGWRRLERALAAALARVEVRRNPRGVSLLGMGTLILVWLGMVIARNPQAIAHTLFDLLQM
jgi:uncharacterized membrane protein